MLIMRQFTGSDDPMILAKNYSELLAEFGSLDALSDAIGKSKSHCSRMLSLLKLPVEAQKLVSSGQLPVTNAAKKYRNMNRIAKPHSNILTGNQSAILGGLSIRVFLTVSQFSAILSISEYSVRRALSELLSRGLVERHDEIRPYVYRLTQGGAARCGCSYQRRWISASAMHQYLMRNEVEVKYRKSNQGFSFLERVELFKLGFHPAVGEHVLAVSDSNNKRFNLIIIDDYQMPLNNLALKLARPHKPMDKYYSGDNKIWIDIIDSLIIFTCDSQRVGIIKRAIKKEVSKVDSLVKMSANDVSEVKEKKRLLSFHKDSVIQILDRTQVRYIDPVLEVR